VKLKDIYPLELKNINTDKNSHIFRHVNSSPDCKEACADNCFSVLDCADTKHQLLIEEGV